ncbi:MAG: hypothetical protein RLZZ618_1584 [Pseudomonadota bacterium]
MRCTEPVCVRMSLAALAIGLGALMAGCASSEADAAAKKHQIAEPKVSMPSPRRMKSMNEVRAQAALRLMEANPQGTYTESPPDVLMAIPVLEVELNGDGSIRRIHVMRYPSQAPETTRMAMDALHRAAPFGDVSHLPKPWKFAEVFLYRHDHRFKPRTLDH